MAFGYCSGANSRPTASLPQLLSSGFFNTSVAMTPDKQHLILSSVFLTTCAQITFGNKPVFPTYIHYILKDVQFAVFGFSCFPFSTATKILEDLYPIKSILRSHLINGNSHTRVIAIIHCNHSCSFERVDHQVPFLRDFNSLDPE